MGPEHNANRLLRKLSDSGWGEFPASLESVSMRAKESACEAGQPLEYVYFPLNAVFSIVVVTEARRQVEIATVGNEGMFGLPLFLGARTAPFKAFVQVPGGALRMKAALFGKFLAKCPALGDVLKLYTHFLIVQISQSAICNRLHPVEQRCARWLLMTHDRVRARQFPLTQESLACMLGIRRSGASPAVGRLKARGLIDYNRGTIRIENRPGLEALSCECYRVVRGEFAF